MKRRIWALVIAGALLLQGCWSRREINDLGAVILFGVDRTEDGKLEVTLSVAQPGAAAGGKGQQQGAPRRARVLLRREAATITEAIRLAELASPRRIAMDHGQVILLGERLTREGVDALLDYLLRSPQVRLSTRVVMVRGSSVPELMASEPLMRSTEAEALRELEATRAGLMITLKDFFIARTSPHMAPIISTISVRPHPTGEAATNRELELTGAAVFKGDRLAVLLDQMETRTAIWMMTDARDAVITSPCPHGDPGLVSIKVNRAKREIVPLWDGRRLSFRVNLTGDIRITDMLCHLVIGSPVELGELEGTLMTELQKRMGEVFARLQAAQTDPFGFGELVRAHLPDVWQRVGGDRWPETWAETPVRVDARMGIVQLNMTNQPPVVVDLPDK